MKCPKCFGENSESKEGNKFFLGTNSREFPFFKCSICGAVFFVDQNDLLPKLAERPEKGSRMIPLIWTVIYLVAAGAMYWYFGSNLVTWVIGGIILFFAWQAFRIGVSGSQQLIDEMTVDEISEASQKAKDEFRKLGGLD